MRPKTFLPLHGPPVLVPRLFSDNSRVGRATAPTRKGNRATPLISTCYHDSEPLLKEVALALEDPAPCTPNGIGIDFGENALWNIPDSGNNYEVIDFTTGYRQVFVSSRIQ